MVIQKTVQQKDIRSTYNIRKDCLQMVAKNNEQTYNEPIESISDIKLQYGIYSDQIQGVIIENYSTKDKSLLMEVLPKNFNDCLPKIDQDVITRDGCTEWDIEYRYSEPVDETLENLGILDKNAERYLFSRSLKKIEQSRALDYVETIPIEIQYIPYDNVVKLIETKFPYMTEISRYTVINTIRHILSNYEMIITQLDKLNLSSKSMSSCYKIIRDRINTQIVEMWDELKE